MAHAHAKQHDYHLVNPSPWPIVASLSALTTAIGAIIWMRSLGEGAVGLFGIQGPWVFLAGFLGLVMTASLWWRDVIREANQGDHTPVVGLHLRYGMILFIASEVMFFVAWFWAYFDFALFPADVHAIDGISNEMVGMVQRNTLFGGQWPPVPVDATEAVIPATGAPANGYFKGTFDPWGIPLVNTLILLSSGCTVTWAHHALLKNDRRGLVLGLVATVILGMIFTAFQAYEYMHAQFSFAGHGYGSSFFMATGFHGAHVIIGTIFLLVCLVRAIRGAFTPQQHFGFEAAAWYWHFVDVVWLFLFAAIYVWGAGAHAGAGH
ncbi:MAG: cytochrome c oxidase subunit 3 [Hyphomicrobium sp.]|uniref:cytochrome c oxidase subunit 3 n=1 Tax=Hyphomicrobium sp. TaxID=82 RepID=UPI003D12E05E